MTSRPATFARAAAAPIFALALFSSAALIFALQPLFGRMVTPLLGGSPSVWNTSMAFFQAALLAGYLYAHLLARLKDLRIQAVIHVGVLAAAWLVLPIQVSSALGAPNSEQPVLWLLGVLALSVGAPFAVASATAPLLQAWYARTGRVDAHDPYYLYAASNMGSFVGLLAYPIFVEPTLGLHAQSAAWTLVYVGVAATIALCAALTLWSHAQAPTQTAHDAPAPSWRQRGYWIAAAAVPSALSLAVTQHISTDVASAPMLWVIPLALYLLTFVIAFSKGSARLEGATLFVQPAAVALMLAAYNGAGDWIGTVAGILGGFFFSALVCHLALARTRPGVDRLTEFYFFVSLGGVLGGVFAALIAPVVFNNVYEFPLALALVALFRPRETSDLVRLNNATLAASIMMVVLALTMLRLEPLDSVIVLGALGAAAAMVAAGWADDGRPAPLRYAFLVVAAIHAALVIWIAFNLDTIFAGEISEGVERVSAREPWGWALGLTSFLMLAFAVHGTIQPARVDTRIADFSLGAALPSVVLLLLLVLAPDRVDARFLTTFGILFCAVAIFVNRGRPIVMAAIVLLGFAIMFLDDVRGGRVITQERSFFGVMRTRVVESSDPAAPPLRILLHGTTIHGAQLAREGFTRLPLTYYNPRTALGEAIVAGLSMHDSARLALIGLGTGSTACLTRNTDEMVIFEIDPMVVRLSAQQGGDFTYVTECQPNARVELGDARLQIAEEPDASFDVIVVDAFSSDAIPAHLLTREALALYLSKASEDGIVVLHLSNRHLALVSEAARVARDLGALTLFRVSERFEQPYVSYYGGLAASVMVVARSPETLARLPVRLGDWRTFKPPEGQGWSDDYINLPRALWEGVSGAEECRVYSYLPQCEGAAPEVSPTN
jgi:hypothetical protein